MPRYYFGIHDGFDLHDETGRDIGNLGKVRREALKVISGLAAAGGEDSDGYTIVLNVRDEKGARALTLRMVCQVDAPLTRSLKLAS